MIFSIDLKKLHLVDDIRPGLFNAIQQVINGGIDMDIPANLVLFLMEFHFIDKGICEIFLLCSDNISYLQKEEEYSRCIYSYYSNRLSTIVSVENVKEKIGYSQLEARVNSEMFIEIPLNKNLHLIVNSEFSTASLSCIEKKWFENIVNVLVRTRDGEP